MCQKFNKYWLQYQKSAYEMVKEFVNYQENKLKENNMEDRNKTVAELIADLQNQLDRANDRIEELVKKNDELKEVNTTQFKNLHDLRLEYNGLHNKFHTLDIEHAALIGKYCDYNKAAQDAWNENNKIKKENEYLEKEITKWHSKYTKEKAKHDKATKMIDELKKNQKDELVWSNIRRYDNIDSQLYSFWRLKEYYHETKYNKNEKNDKRREMKHAKDYGWFQYDSLDKWRLF